MNEECMTDSIHQQSSPFIHDALIEPVEKVQLAHKFMITVCIITETALSKIYHFPTAPQNLRRLYIHHPLYTAECCHL